MPPATPHASMRSRLGVRPVPLYIGLLTNCIYVIFWLLISLVRIHIPLWRVANGPLFFKKGRGVVRMTSPCCYWWEPWSLAADLTLDTKQEGHTVRGKQPKIRQLRLAPPLAGNPKSAPYGPKFSQFHAVFRKIWQNHMLVPPGGLAPPPTGNPRSAPGKTNMILFGLSKKRPL